MPLLISLESLHALPSPRSASILYANPVDPSSRLYPFRRRDRFLEAGFLQVVYEKTEGSNPDEQGECPGTNDHGLEKKGQGQFLSGLETTTSLQSRQEAPSEERIPTEASDSPNSKELKPRPLLLHATVAKSGIYTFDARNILSCYRDYYLDGAQDSIAV